MHITGVVPKDRKPESIENVKNFLLEVLGGNNDSYWPSSTLTIVWINGKLHHVTSGRWQITDGYVYLPRLREGYENGVGADQQIAILAAIAEFWDLGHDPEIKEALQKAMVKVIADLWTSVARVTTHLAEDSEGRPIQEIALRNGDIAAKLGDVWRKPNGEAVNVDEGWTSFNLVGV